MVMLASDDDGTCQTYAATGSLRGSRDAGGSTHRLINLNCALGLDVTGDNTAQRPQWYGATASPRRSGSWNSAERAP